MKKWIKANKNNLIVFSIYTIISFSLIFFHEAWRDEAQAWLLARELSFVELISQMKYEGHFLLWYLILMPFAKLGFPYITTNIISWFITVISAWLILRYAPFKAYKKYLFIFSFPMLYLFPIISRCYCLIPLAITLIAIFYKERKAKPIRYVLAVALLANTHIIMLGMVGILLLEFYIEQFKERKNNTKEVNMKTVWSLILIIILLILSGAPLINSLTTNEGVFFENSFIIKIFDMLVIEPYIMILNIYCAFSNNSYILVVIIVLISIFILEEIINYKKDFIKIVLILLWQYMIGAFIFGISYQRAATGILVILFYRWIRAYRTQKEIKKVDKKINEIVLVALLIINIIGGIIFIYVEINNNYSSAYQVGEYINNNIEENSIMITGSQSYCSAIIPYLSSKAKFYYIQEDKYFTYTVWNEKNKEELDANFIEQIRDKFDETQNLYYIYARGRDWEKKEEKILDEMVEKGILIKVFESDEDFCAKENYIVYKMDIDNDKK